MYPSFAGRLLLDKPVPMALEAKGALAPWRMMFSGGMTERDDGTRDFAFTADGAPRICGTFRVENGAAGGASRPGEPTGAARRAARNGGSGAAPPPVVHAGDFDTAYMKSLADIRRDLGIDGGAPGGRALPELGGGAVRIDRERGTFLIDTPRTCGVFAEGGAHTAGVLRVEIADIPTTIWASSLDGSPLSESSRILLTHLTDVQNTGEEFADAEMTILKARGNLPCLMRAGHADVSLAIERGSGAESPSFAVFALAPDGTRIAEMPCTNDGGALRFTADIARDPTSATYLYEIVRGK